MLNSKWFYRMVFCLLRFQTIIMDPSIVLCVLANLNYFDSPSICHWLRICQIFFYSSAITLGSKKICLIFVEYLI